MKNNFLALLFLLAAIFPGPLPAQNTKATGLYQIGKKNYDDEKYPVAIKIRIS